MPLRIEVITAVFHSPCSVQLLFLKAKKIGGCLKPSKLDMCNRVRGKGVTSCLHYDKIKKIDENEYSAGCFRWSIHMFLTIQNVCSGRPCFPERPMK